MVPFEIFLNKRKALRGSGQVLRLQTLQKKDRSCGSAKKTTTIIHSVAVHFDPRAKTS